MAEQKRKNSIVLNQSGGASVLEAVAAEQKERTNSVSQPEEIKASDKQDPWLCYDEVEMQVEMNKQTSERRASFEKAQEKALGESRDERTSSSLSQKGRSSHSRMSE